MELFFTKTTHQVIAKFERGEKDINNYTKNWCQEWNTHGLDTASSIVWRQEFQELKRYCPSQRATTIVNTASSLDLATQ